MSEARDALDVLDHEAVWMGKPVGDHGTCVLCAWHWPNHDPECAVGNALATVRAALAAVEQLASAAEPMARLPIPLSTEERTEWLTNQNRLRDVLARFQAAALAAAQGKVILDYAYAHATWEPEPPAWLARAYDAIEAALRDTGEPDGGGAK